MKLNHINLTVEDVLVTSTFLETYFGLQALKKANPHMALLSDENGMIVNIFKGDAVSYPASFHVGFVQENQTRVNELYQRLTADGVQAEEPHKFHGSWTFYFKCPGNFVIEVLCMLKTDSSLQPNPNLEFERSTARHSAA